MQKLPESFNSIFEEQVYSILDYENPFKRSNKLGHITASGLVINNGKVLLIFHPFIKRWFQPGGHIDDGELPIDAAIREVYEETGFICVPDSKDLEPIDIDIHEIPANPKKGEDTHLHIDLLYCLRVSSQEQSTEDLACAWISFDQVESDRIKRALAKLN
ncbi:NUDIX hydrolase [Polynucleobacter nymphae]|uniref:NUDIX hydrolase n=1 Tax=Polynucleobacter nymphae TaxID=2081043 RepID=UPI001C0D99D9|nr:NUDIX domain-containing protein [Polynucleobacter nymphae]MBU3607522.1 NUDIX domain-containing protein [Polynucleobacter nymphae]